MLLQLQSGRERKSPVLQQLKVIKFETEKNETLETQIGVITWNVEQHYRLHFYLLSYIFDVASFLSHFASLTLVLGNFPTIKPQYYPFKISKLHHFGFGFTSLS